MCRHLLNQCLIFDPKSMFKLTKHQYCTGNRLQDIEDSYITFSSFPINTEYSSSSLNYQMKKKTTYCIMSSCASIETKSRKLIRSFRYLWTISYDLELYISYTYILLYNLYKTGYISWHISFVTQKVSAKLTQLWFFSSLQSYWLLNRHFHHKQEFSGFLLIHSK